jgi:hypothetical protein
VKDTFVIYTRAWVPSSGEPFFQYQAFGSGRLADRFFEWLNGKPLAAFKENGPWTHWVFSNPIHDETIRVAWGAFIQDEPTHFENVSGQFDENMMIGIEAYRASKTLALANTFEIWA